MNDVSNLVDEAMAKWAEETDTGINDPAFAGEVGEDIDKLVDGLTPYEASALLKDDKPIIFVEGGNCMKELKSGLLTNKYTRVFHEKDYKFNAPHHFKVVRADKELHFTSQWGENTICEIDFQEGPIKECGVNGVANEDLINMVICRLEGFQNSEFACKENEQAINKLYEALMWLRKRTNDREARGVEGTHTI